jgi:Protein of unknown function (DUF3892)/D-arabinono-1,4-lactone oxidase
MCWIRRRWLTTDPDLDPVMGEDLLCGGRGVTASALLVAASRALTAYAGVISGIPVYGLIKAPQILAQAIYLDAQSLRLDLTGGEALALVLKAAWAVDAGHTVQHFAEMALEGQFKKSSTDGRRGPSHLIMTNNREVNQSECYRGDSIELIFDAHEASYIAFLETMLAVAPSFRQSGYISIRFSASSRATLSMHNVQHPHAVSVEVTSLKGLEGNADWMRFLERNAVEVKGRPHWGQINKLRSTDVLMLYEDKLNRWREVLLALSGISSTFSNAYTVQRGLEPSAIVREVRATAKKRYTTILNTHLCGGPNSKWDPVSVAEAIDQIETNTVIYFTKVNDKVARVIVVDDPKKGRYLGTNGKYLRTTANGTRRNNLDRLPNCKSTKS